MGGAVGVNVVGDAVGPEVGAQVGAEVEIVTEAAVMVPYVDPIELKTLAGVEERADAKVEAAAELEDPNPTTETTTTLPDEMDETVTSDVDTPAEVAMSDLKVAVNVEVNVASSKLEMSRDENVTEEATCIEEVVGAVVGGQVNPDTVGVAVGAPVVGGAVGDTVVGEVVGDTVVGDVVGTVVVGDAVGEAVGVIVVGDQVGVIVVGERDVGVRVWGDAVGEPVWNLKSADSHSGSSSPICPAAPPRLLVSPTPSWPHSL